MGSEAGESTFNSSSVLRTAPAGILGSSAFPRRVPQACSMLCRSGGRVITILVTLGALHSTPSDATAFAPDRDGRRESQRVTGHVRNAGRVIVLDNRSLSSERYRIPDNRTLDNGYSIAPNQPLTGAIHAGMAPPAVASLRIAEAGRKLLQQGDYARALIHFEKSLGLGSNPFNYYYLALIHYRLGNYQQALNFIEVAESRLHDHSTWISELSRLRNAASHAFRSSSVQQDPRPTTNATTPSVSETKAKVPAKPVAADGGVARERHYLLLLDLLLFSLTAWVFLSAVSSLSGLRPR
jgi:hypothetical protein